MNAAPSIMTGAFTGRYLMKTEFDEYEANEDGWSDWIEPVTNDYKLACCDCGLVHSVDFRTENGEIQIRFKIDKSLTEERRMLKNA